MFSEQKWNILKSLSQQKLSPIQLAQKLNTTMANISQQMRLLEAANLVKKEKIKNRDKGKPRTLFSLSENFAYLIPAMQNFADKKLLKVTEHHQITLKIWFLENAELQSNVEKSYWKIEPYMSRIQAMAINLNSKEFVVVADRPDEIEKAVGKSKAIASKVITKEEAEKVFRQSPMSQWAFIYDKANLWLRKNPN